MKEQPKPMSASAVLLFEVLTLKAIVAVMIEEFLEDAGDGRAEKLKRLKSMVDAQLRYIAVPKDFEPAKAQIARVVREETHAFMARFEERGGRPT